MNWSDWSLDPSLIYVIGGGLLYLVGGLRGSSALRTSWKRQAAFYGGLLTIVMALDSPLDGYADQLFWAHMTQHILLLTVAPPLILLGRPWPRMWLGLPAGVRAPVGRALAQSRWAAPMRALAHPLGAFILFNATVVAWHFPGAYEATLRSQAIHDIEHAMFFFTGLLFWARVVDPGPLRRPMTWPLKAAYVTGAMIVGWVLAITLVVVPHPLYAHYAHLAHRPGGITALTDQQLAAGMMWVPGSIAYTVALLIAVWRWVEPDHRMREEPVPT